MKIAGVLYGGRLRLLGFGIRQTLFKGVGDLQRQTVPVAPVQRHEKRVICRHAVVLKTAACIDLGVLWERPKSMVDWCSCAPQRVEPRKGGNHSYGVPSHGGIQFIAQAEGTQRNVVGIFQRRTKVLGLVALIADFKDKVLCKLLLNLERPLIEHVRFALRRPDPLVAQGLTVEDARVEIGRLTVGREAVVGQERWRKAIAAGKRRLNLVTNVHSAPVVGIEKRTGYQTCAAANHG